jgi:ABC-type sulfate transport system substrate-binding protein
MVRFGSTKYDIAVVYEASAIAGLGHAEGRWGKLKICYPAQTIWSDNPAAVLEAPWVSDAQKRAAKTYLAFLRARPAQERALVFGFRPANTSIDVITQDAQNPFVRFAGHGVTVDVPPAVDMPGGPVLRDLMSQWARMMQDEVSRNRPSIP